MESQHQNPEFRNNLEIFHPCILTTSEDPDAANVTPHQGLHRLLR